MKQAAFFYTALLLAVVSFPSAHTWPVPSAECPTIQAGIDSASLGDTVLVAAGTYTGEGNKNLDFGGTDLVLVSQDGPELTIIDCQRSGGGLYFHSGETGAAVVEGFTITNGLRPGDWGGGISCIYGSSPTIRNCTFYGNFASRGGGMGCWNSSPTVSNCTFYQNSAGDGGGVYCDGSSPIVTDCEFSENVASGGSGMFCWHSSPTVSNCDFVGNSGEFGGGLACGDGSSPTVSNCNFVGNSACQGYLGGGGVFCWHSSPAVRSCTFCGNSAFEGAGVQCLESSYPLIENTIIAFSPVGEAVWCTYTGSATLTCCDVYGNAGGDWVDCIADQYGINGNFSACPSFCNAFAEPFDLLLCDESPCLPGNHPDGYDCGLIGAWPVGCSCGPSRTHGTTWGAIKAMYR